MKKLSFVLASVCLAVLLSACGSPKSSQSGSEPPTAGTASVSTAATEKTAAEPTEKQTAASTERPTPTATEKPTQAFTATQAVAETEAKSSEMRLSINGETVEVRWEENDAVAALKEAVKNSPLTINMSMYGGFEQVGSLGMSLPQNDVRTTTEAGDIVLYSGNQMVVFYGSNTWEYTRLGKIVNKTSNRLESLLSNGDVVLTVYTNT